MADYSKKEITKLTPQEQIQRIEHDASAIRGHHPDSRAASTELYRELMYLHGHQNAESEIARLLRSDAQQGNVDAFDGLAFLELPLEDQD